jgi:hypothetical protein
VRLRTAGITRLRDEYLFALAHLCHVSPNEPLKLRDLFRLVIEIDAYVTANKETGA